MDPELFKILETFYKKLHYNIIRSEKKLRNNSVLWTLVELKSKKVESLLNDSCFASTDFDSKSVIYLEEACYIFKFQNLTKLNGYVISTKGIWEIEMVSQNFTFETLLQFIQKKHLNFEKKHEPINDKDKLSLFALLCIRNLSKDSPMDLNSVKFRDEWLKIFNSVFNFLNENGFLNSKNLSINEVLSSKGSEHIVQNLMRHRNDLPIKSSQIFCNPGGSKFYLNIVEGDRINFEKLKVIFKMVFPEIPSLDTVTLIADFCNTTANDMAKYVKNDFAYIDSSYDDLYSQTLKDIYINV